MGLVDIPNFRSSHTYPVSCSAGIPIFITIFSVVFILSQKIYDAYTLSLLGASFVFILGVYDDMKDIRARYKIIIITLAAVLSCANELIVLNLGTYFGNSIELLNWIARPLTVFSVIGFTNAFNLIDGLDGLAGIISIIMLSSLWFIGYQNNDNFLMNLPPLIISVLLAFLIYNWNPASVFMGDSGSLTLGFIISILCIKALSYVSPVVVLYLLAVPVIDTIVIIVRRKRYGQSIFSPDKNHAHHVALNLFNQDVKKSVLVIAFIQLVYMLMGVFLVRIIPQEISLLMFILSIIFWYFILTRLSSNHFQLIKD